MQRKPLHSVPPTQVCLRGLLPSALVGPNPDRVHTPNTWTGGPYSSCLVFQLLAPAEILGWDLHCQRYMRLQAARAPSLVQWYWDQAVCYGAPGHKSPFMSISWLQAIGSNQHPRSPLSSKGLVQMAANEGREGVQRQRRNSQETIVAGLPWWSSELPLQGVQVWSLVETKIPYAERSKTRWNKTERNNSAPMGQGPGSPSADIHNNISELFCRYWNPCQVEVNCMLPTST